VDVGDVNRLALVERALRERGEVTGCSGYPDARDARPVGAG
jgi:hypothetical protein